MPPGVNISSQTRAMPISGVNVGRKNTSRNNCRPHDRLPIHTAMAERDHEVQHQVFRGVEQRDAEHGPEDRVVGKQVDVVGQADEARLADHLPVAEAQQQRCEQRQDQEGRETEEAGQQGIAARRSERRRRRGISAAKRVTWLARL